MTFPVTPNTGSHVQPLVSDRVTEPTLAGRLIHVSSACTELHFTAGRQTIYTHKKSLLSSMLSLVCLFPEHARSGKFSRSPITEWAICLKPISEKANSPKNRFITFAYTIQLFRWGSWVCSCPPYSVLRNI